MFTFHIEAGAVIILASHMALTDLLHGALSTATTDGDDHFLTQVFVPR
jgi:hypothetical protein